MSEELAYTPGLFTVKRHVRGNWACALCKALVQAPVPAAVIDKPGLRRVVQPSTARDRDLLRAYPL